MTSTAFTLSELMTEAASGLHCRLRLTAPAKPGKLLILLHGLGSNKSN
jgi:hypothetical protein